MRKPALLVSLGLPAAALLLLLTVAAVRLPLIAPHKTVMPLSIRYSPPQSAPPGGGGQPSTQAAPDRPAPRPAPRPFAPPRLAVSGPHLPVAVVLNEDPCIKLAYAGLEDLPGLPGAGGSGLTGFAGAPKAGRPGNAAPGPGGRIMQRTLFKNTASIRLASAARPAAAWAPAFSTRTAAVPIFLRRSAKACSANPGVRATGPGQTARVPPEDRCGKRSVLIGTTTPSGEMNHKLAYGGGHTCVSNVACSWWSPTPRTSLRNW